jgi:adenylosuccinate synthase
MQTQKFLQPGVLNIGFIDGQWGSSGKGKFNDLLAHENKLDFAISQNSVNASHIVAFDDGTEYKFQHLPSSTTNLHCKLIIGAGASIDLDQLMKEIADWNLGPDRLFIHPNAVVITQDDVEYEKEHLARIASTMTGNGAAAARKVMRHPDAKTAMDFPELRPFIRDTTSLVIGWLKQGKTGILETAQGFDLSMDHGMLREINGEIHRAYPFTTSRNVDPLTFAGMCGVPKHLLGPVFLNLRTFPIRVGDGSNCKVDGLNGVSLEGSSSGAYWPDQEEMTWEQVSRFCGGGANLQEQTSLTKRVRRVFSFSEMQLRHITQTVAPTFISLNFVNYLDHGIWGKKGVWSRSVLQDLHPKVANFVKMVEESQYWVDTPQAGRVMWLGTGARRSEYIRLL